jgi:hypothetical protein
MSESEKFLMNIRASLLVCFNGVALICVLATIVGRVRGVDTTVNEWPLVWGLACGMWAATSITFLIFMSALRRAKGSVGRSI